MKILVTNDDGIESPGIHSLVRHLAATAHEVVVVAPDRDWSGSGAALGEFDVDRPLPVQRVEIPGSETVPSWALAGPPAATVVAALLGAFGTPPDLVVAGINAGLNTGRTVLHSGTVGAALTGQNFGVSGLAVSVASGDQWFWDTAAVLAVGVLDLVCDGPPRSVLNLNVPALPRDEVRGVRWARLAPFGAVRAAVRSSGETQIEMELVRTGYTPAEDTDQGCVDRGFASLTTLAGIVEAWPETRPERGAESVRLVPGAALHQVHQLPDVSDHRLLHPRLVAPHTDGTR